jgi:sphingolipid 4-desaturase/C4-monooxygenase
MGKGGDNTTTAGSAAAASVLSTTQKQQDKASSAASPWKDDFLWSTLDEPHASRRKQILAKYPQIKSLYGHDEMFKYKIGLVLLIQYSLAYYFRNQVSFPFWNSSSSGDAGGSGKQPWWVFWAVAYVVGGTCNHGCMMAIHEMSHNLGFKTPKLNRWFAVLANTPLGIPSAAAFKRYHMDHHKYQGVDGIDVDIPTAAEGRIFQSTLLKLLFVCFQMCFYALRPVLVAPKSPGIAEAMNTGVVFGVDALLVYFWGPGALLYWLVSTLFGMGVSIR